MATELLLIVNSYKAERTFFYLDTFPTNAGEQQSR